MDKHNSPGTILSALLGLLSTKRTASLFAFSAD